MAAIPLTTSFILQTGSFLNSCQSTNVGQCREIMREFAPYFRTGPCLEVSTNITLPCHSSQLPPGYPSPTPLGSHIQPIRARNIYNTKPPNLPGSELPSLCWNLSLDLLHPALLANNFCSCLVLTSDAGLTRAGVPRIIQCGALCGSIVQIVSFLITVNR